MLADQEELRTFTGCTQPAAVARHLRRALGLDWIAVNAAGLVNMPEDTWQAIKRGQYRAPTPQTQLATPARTAHTYALRIPERKAA